MILVDGKSTSKTSFRQVRHCCAPYFIYNFYLWLAMNANNNSSMFT